MAMDLMTKCPQCGTVFAASMDQLQLRKGYIRCVSCAHIFDGYDAVVPQGPNAEASAAPANAPTQPQQVQANQVQANQVQANQVQAPPPSAGNLPDVVRQRAPVAPLDVSIVPPRSVPEPWGRGKQAAPVPSVDSEPVLGLGSGYVKDADPALGRGMTFTAGRSEPGLYSQPEALSRDARSASGIYTEPQGADEFRLDGGDRAAARTVDELPDFLHARRRRRGALARLLWSVLILIGLACLAAQLMYVYRMQIASNVPLLRPVLEQACEPLQCKVGYPRRIERIAIMDSSLQAAPGVGEAKSDDSALLLRVVLRNNYDKPQTWPSLTLDLVDFSGSVVARRTIAPGVYLPAQALGGPFPAGSEIHIAVPVTVSGVKINGYQLGKFYPPEG